MQLIRLFLRQDLHIIVNSFPYPSSSFIITSSSFIINILLPLIVDSNNLDSLIIIIDNHLALNVIIIMCFIIGNPVKIDIICFSYFGFSSFRIISYNPEVVNLINSFLF